MNCPACKYNPGHNDSSGIPKRLTYGNFFDITNKAVRDAQVYSLVGCPVCGIVFINFNDIDSRRG